MAAELYQIAQQSHKQMMGYVLKTAEGKLAVIDGGTRMDAPYLLKLLETLGGPRPHVDVWFLTHAHSDHIHAFLHLMTEHEGMFTVGAVCHHFPSIFFIDEHEPAAARTLRDYESVRPLFVDRERVLEEGDAVRVGSARFTVLYVTDPAFEQNAVNNSSTVLRLDVAETGVLFLGDLGLEGGEKLLARHGAALQSDLVQMAHHGQQGVSMPVYEAIRPSVCLWCAPLWLWENNQGNRGFNSGPWKTIETYEAMLNLGVREHVIAKDGTYCITLDAGGWRVCCVDADAAL